MNKEILLVAETVSNEKGVSRDVIFEAIESALAAATKKRFKEEDVEIRVEIDRVSGDSRTFRVWHVVPDEELYEFGRQLTLDEAHEHDEKLQIGDTYEEEVASESFGRIAAQTAKQVIVQKVREAERRQIVEEYRDRIGELISGVVKKASRDSIVLDLGANAEALITREHMITRESVRQNDRLRAYLLGVNEENRGPQLFASRACPEMLVELFKIEVPEIGEELIEIKGAARDPGSRAKIAVKGIAKLHAHTWNDTERHGWLPKMGDGAFDVIEDLVKKSWPKYEKYLGEEGMAHLTPEAEVTRDFFTRFGEVVHVGVALDNRERRVPRRVELAHLRRPRVAPITSAPHFLRRVQRPRQADARPLPAREHGATLADVGEVARGQRVELAADLGPRRR